MLGVEGLLDPEELPELQTDLRTESGSQLVEKDRLE